MSRPSGGTLPPSKQRRSYLIISKIGEGHWIRISRPEEHEYEVLHILLSIPCIYWKNLDAADVLQYLYQYARSHCNDICIQYRTMEALSVSSLSVQLRGLPVPSPWVLFPKIRDDGKEPDLTMIPAINRRALAAKKGLILNLF